MGNPVGGSVEFYAHNYSLPVKFDFNTKISFDRGNENYNNSVIVANGVTRVEKGGDKIKVRLNSEFYELENIFNADGDKTTFSQEDYNALVANRNKAIILDTGDSFAAYKVVSTDEDLKQGIIKIERHNVLNIKNKKTVANGNNFIIDIQTPEEIAKGEIIGQKPASVVVKWNEGNEKKTRTINFAGHFGFSIDNTTYTVKDGKVYNNNNEEIKEITLSKRAAYQLVGMSCIENPLNRDYSFTPGDIKKAQSNYNKSKANGDDRTKDVIGYGAGEFVGASCDGTKYTTEYGYYEQKGRIFTRTTKKSSIVSIWTCK